MARRSETVSDFLNFAIAAPCTTVMTTVLLPSLANRFSGPLNVEVEKTTGSEK
jgi:hypothetical protein